jgi:hypothetical protein
MLMGGQLLAQAALQPAQTAPPTRDEIRKTMGIPSQGDLSPFLSISSLELAPGPQKAWTSVFPQMLYGGLWYACCRPVCVSITVIQYSTSVMAP